MHHPTKIATCSYCGSRQTLSLSARDGHELACSACGAPLHEMKWLKPPSSSKKAKKSGKKAASHGTGWPQDDWQGHRDAPKRRKKKKKSSFFKKAFEEAFDVIDDIFD